MLVEFRRSDQANQRGGALAAARRSSKQSVLATEYPWANLVFTTIIVHWHFPVVELAHKRGLAFEAVT
jgi:hypothetical protein